MSGARQRQVAIVVPGAAVWEGGQPSDALRRRVAFGAALFHQHGADWMVTTGGLGRYPPSEAELAADLAVEMGVPAHAILRENKSTNSFENMVFARQTIGASNAAATTFMVVSDWYHLPRLWMVLRIINQDCRMVAVPRVYYRSRLAFLQWRSALNELVKLPYYALTLRRRWRGWQRDTLAH